ncbi:cytochrome P450 714C3 isoform X1 [Lolium perenne]|uniref:cytochrome P450 714C3 isoform X1 n=2 Tax=Lolium perenne TaxID=4522 RepID=UPI0021F67FDB|nr:cytochrome P450 714C3-like isoform X1 [Lolium perenne]
MEWLLVFLFTGALDPYGILNFADESTRKAEEEALADNLGYVLVLPVLLGLALLYICDIVWLRPERIRRRWRKQGVRGPRPTLLFGNTQEMKKIRQDLAPAQKQDTNNYVYTLFSHLLVWTKTYGSVFLYSIGTVDILYISDPAMVKDMSHCTSSQLGKPIYLQKSRKPLFGEGILISNGDIWAYERKIIAPELFMEKIKVMIGLIVEASVPLLEAWESMLDNSGGIREIDVDGYMRNFSADVIARACFGSDFATGEEIFSKLRQLQKAISQQDSLVGLSALWKYLPTKSNKEMRELEQEVRLLILDVARREGSSSSNSTIYMHTTHNDLLRSIVDGAQQCPSYPGTAEDFIVDNCKNMYFGGHETTAITATWCLMLLATHPEWQDRARAEVLDVCCGDTAIDFDVLRRLKTITMVIQETVRLFPPASLMAREALTDVKLGGLDIPQGTIIQTGIAVVHLDRDIWGQDAGEFRPDRFMNGAAAACKPAHMYMPFGHGPRSCPGQHLAVVELKVLLVRLLSKYSFSPSPGYRHAPLFRLTIEPGFGMPLVVTRLP